VLLRAPASMIGCFDGESFDANDYVDFIVFAKIRSFVIQGKSIAILSDNI
jgi:hypothetical protein